jgi:4'-phosphopantetheinyl transferase
VAVRWARPESLKARTGSLLDRLSPEERRAAARFHVPADAAAYAAAHALLRVTLSEYEPSDPAEWRFAGGPHGKPELAPGLGAGLYFNLSHTRGCVACAVTRGAEVGIDVENRERTVDVLEVANRSFTAREYSLLAACSPRGQKERFLRSWTLKEALLKALGTGLSEPMEDFEFSFPSGVEDGGSIRLAVAPRGVDADTGWHFDQRVLGNRHIVAVAVRAPQGREPTIEFREVNNL